MNIEKIYYILLLCFIYSIGLQAQTSQEDLLKAAKQEVGKTQSMKPLSDLIASGQLTEDRILAMAYIGRAKMNQRLDRKYWHKFVWEEPIRDSLVLNILADYEQAIRTCPGCAVVVQKNRYEFLHKTAPKTEMFKDDFAKIKAAGYKPDQKGVMLSLHAWQRSGLWLGGSISPFGTISPYYKLRFKAPSTDKKDQFFRHKPFNFNALALAYSRKLDRNLNDISFSVFQLNAPIVLNLNTIGVQFGKDTEGEKIAPRWYYRPEIGFGIGHLSLSAGYDLFFRKSARKASDQFFVQLRYAFIAN
jgi:hypothetical protein